MSAEHTPISGEPTSFIELNDKPIQVYVDAPDFPADDPERMAPCAAHIAEGRHIDLENDFWMAGCHFPESGDPQIIRFQIACSGLSRFRKRCRMQLTQYDSEGKVLTRGKVSE